MKAARSFPTTLQYVHPLAGGSNDIGSAMHVRPGTRVALHQAFRCCPFAGAVSSQVHDYLEANGFVLAANPDEAEVHVVNTCGSDAAQAQITWDTLAEVRRRTPEARIVAIGCLVSIEPRRLAESLVGVPESARLDPRHTAELDTIFGGPVPFADVQPALRNDYVGNDFAKDWFHIVASTGCLGSCSFCAIRRATGRPRSRPVADVLADVARGRAAGRFDQLLVSTDLSAWGHDLGLTVVDLLRAVTEAAGEEVRLAGRASSPRCSSSTSRRCCPCSRAGAGPTWACRSSRVARASCGRCPAPTTRRLCSARCNASGRPRPIWCSEPT